METSDGISFEKAFPDIRRICTAAGFPFETGARVSEALGQIERTLVHQAQRIGHLESIAYRDDAGIFKINGDD